MTVSAFQMCALEDAVENWMDNDTLACARCGESFDDAGDGYGGLCPSCADASEDAFERGLALAHDGISEGEGTDMTTMQQIMIRAIAQTYAIEDQARTQSPDACAVIFGRMYALSTWMGNRYPEDQFMAMIDAALAYQYGRQAE